MKFRFFLAFPLCKNLCQIPLKLSFRVFRFFVRFLSVFHQTKPRSTLTSSHYGRGCWFFYNYLIMWGTELVWERKWVNEWCDLSNRYSTVVPSQWNVRKRLKGNEGKMKKKKNDKSNFEKALRVGKVLFSFSFSFRFVLPRVEFFSPFSVFLSHWLMVWGRENIYTQHGNREWYSRNSNIKLWEK